MFTQVLKKKQIEICFGEMCTQIYLTTDILNIYFTTIFSYNSFTILNKFYENKQANESKK